MVMDGSPKGYGAPPCKPVPQLDHEIDAFGFDSRADLFIEFVASILNGIFLIVLAFQLAVFKRGLFSFVNGFVDSFSIFIWLIQPHP